MNCVFCCNHIYLFLYLTVPVSFRFVNWSFPLNGNLVLQLVGLGDCDLCDSIDLDLEYFPLSVLCKYPCLRLR